MPTTGTGLRARIAREAVITLSCVPEDMPVRGNALASGDDELDRQAEDEIIRRLNDGNDWAWCTVVVRGTWKGLEAFDSLGGCSYRDEAEFTQPGWYYEDMVANVLDSLADDAAEVAEAVDEAE